MKITSKQYKDLDEMYMYMDNLGVEDNFSFNLTMIDGEPIMQLFDYRRAKGYILTREQKLNDS